MKTLHSIFKHICLPIFFILFFTFCHKNTECQGKVEDVNWKPLPNKGVYLIDIYKNKETATLITQTDSNGKFYFSAKTKNSHSYAVTFDRPNFAYYRLKEGESHNLSIFLPN
ncbi:MAG: hypothetical protein IPM51_03145 [Sphingobacteriaceae bacterium]|nr:hypothetical protein [Sphingobacteriaceae bacterium]